MRGSLVFVAIILGAVLVMGPRSVAAQGAMTCLGQPVTIVGTGGTVRGSGGPDVIHTDNGIPEVVYAGAGADVICAGLGDIVYAGSGADVVLAVNASEVYGESGADNIQTIGSKFIYGGSGNDLLVDLAGQSFLFGESGSDAHFFGAFCDGGSGNDTETGCADTDNIP